MAAFLAAESSGIEPLGQLLLRRGAIDTSQLEHALRLQRRHGARLGDILLCGGDIAPDALYETLAEHLHCPFVDLTEAPADPALFDSADLDSYLHFCALPWRRDQDALILAGSEWNIQSLAWARARYSGELRFAICSPHDVRRTIERQFGEHISEDSRLRLWQAAPEFSARQVLSRRQKIILCTGLPLAAAAAMFSPAGVALFFVCVCHCVYTAVLAFRLIVFQKGVAIRSGKPRVEVGLAAMDERTLPVYTILVPMYREAKSLPGMLACMRRLDYPPSKLDIKLVLEADDYETLRAAHKLRTHCHFEIVRVPPGLPRTKPKACNYALRFARGEYVTIFDADDRPEPLQLKKAVHAFRHAPQNVACLQARLNYYNANDNLLTRFFSLEYAILFRFMLAGLERMNIPIPLGGTSNHMPLKALRTLGEWDPYNVTEDADLGVRLSAAGYRTRMLDSYTMEEAPVAVWPWIRQRSRWIKGYMQTWLVHMRHPRGLYRQVGLKGFIGFQFFMGLSSFTFLTAPLMWGISALWMAGLVGFQTPLPGWGYAIAALNLLLNFTLHWYFTLRSAARYRRSARSMRRAAVLYPFYLALHSIASYKALWQLVFRPHFWEKTAHGIAQSLQFSAVRREH